MSDWTSRQRMAIVTAVVVIVSSVGFVGLVWPEAPSRIAVVKPIFSATAYRDAFYTFYQRYGWVDPGTFVTTDLNYLNVTVKYSWGHSEDLSEFFNSTRRTLPMMIFGERITYIDEIDVAMGALFQEEQRAFDVVVLGFSEYVTAEQYAEYRRFVADGGSLILMDACNFLAEVKYYPPNEPGQRGYLSLVRGHGWEFNGTHAWKSVYHRWPEENRNWVGSNYWRFWGGYHYDSFIANTSHQISQYIEANHGEIVETGYGAHEENKLENLTNTEIIGYWNFVNWTEAPDDPVVAYQHFYLKGSVIHTGIVASRRVDDEQFLKEFLVSAIRLGLAGEVGSWEWVRYWNVYSRVATL